MTWFRAPYQVKCGVCGVECDRYPGDSYALASDLPSGSSDLDGRPAPMACEMVWYLGFDRCGSCGYISEDIMSATAQVREGVRSEAYQALCRTEEDPVRAVDFARLAYLEAVKGRFAMQGVALVKAAWICDDAEQPEKAKGFREQACACFEKAVDAGQSLPDNEWDVHLVLIDVRRRIGRFRAAVEYAETLLERVREPLIRDLLAFQIGLARSGDSALHRCDEVKAQAMGQ